MKKAINLQVQGQLSGGIASAEALRKALPVAFAQANPGMSLSIKSITDPDSQGNINLKVYIEGEQDPAADFNALSSMAIQKAVAALASKSNPASSVTIKNIQELGDDDEDSGVVLPPQSASVSQGAGTSPSALPSAGEKAASPPLSKVVPNPARRRKHR